MREEERKSQKRERDNEGQSEKDRLKEMRKR